MTSNYSHPDKFYQEKLYPGHTEIPNVVLDYWINRLKPRSFLLLLALFRLEEVKDTDSNIKRKDLTKKTRLTPHLLTSAIRELKFEGLIWVKTGGYKGTFYETNLNGKN